MTDSKFRPVRLAAVASAAAAILALSGCSGDAGGEGSTPGTSEASASPSASSTETAGGGSGSPSASPSASATGSYEPATSAGPAKNVPVPEMPETIKEQSEDGVEAALAYWWKSSHYLQVTGLSEPLESISSEDCEVCSTLISDWTSVYNADGWMVAEPVTGEVLDVRKEGEGDTALFTAETKESPSFLYRPSGELVESGSDSEPGVSAWSGSAAYTADGWVVTSMSLIRTNR